LKESLQILLVEDDLLAAKLVRVVLDKNQTYDTEITHVTRIADALDQIERQVFDVILLDLNLPDSTAEQTLDRFGDMARQMPVIVLTGNDSEEVGVRAVQLGAQDYLVKGEYNDRILLRALRYARERHRMWSTLHRLSVIDELSGVYNRRGFFTVVEPLYEEVSKDENKQSILFFFDLDEFKQVNDTYGHEKGDEALRAFSKMLRLTFSDNDVVGRVGGDEFVAFVEDSQGLEPTHWLERFEAKLNEFNEENSLPFQMKFSCGFRKVGHEESLALDMALNQADEKLYEEKKKKKQQARQNIQPKDLS